MMMMIIVMMVMMMMMMIHRSSRHKDSQNFDALFFRPAWNRTMVMIFKIMIVIKPTPMMAMMIMTIVITQLLLTKRHSNGFQENVVCIEDEKAKETNQDSQQIRPANCDTGLSEKGKRLWLLKTVSSTDKYAYFAIIMVFL